MSANMRSRLCPFQTRFRRSAYYLYQRCISLSATLKEDALKQPVKGESTVSFKKEEMKAKTKMSTKKYYVSKVEMENAVLSFFNNCDHVTLGKLTRHLKREIPLSGLTSHLQSTLSDSRPIFLDLNHLSHHTGIKATDFYAIAEDIAKLKLHEMENFGIPGILPKFSMDNIEDIKYVVGVDIVINQMTWAVMTPERELLDVGSKKLCERQYEYNPQVHHELMSTILKCIPPSAMYVMLSHIPHHHKKVKWRPYQVVMEALLKLCLNHRMNLIEKNGNDVNTISNYVYHLTLSDMDLFHPVTRNKEMIVLNPFLHQWVMSNKGPLRGMNTKLKLKGVKWMEEECRCIFTTDMVSRCLRKKHEDFPAAYFPV